MSARPFTSLRARSAFAVAWAMALLLAHGCRSYRTREFVATEYPAKLENWRIYVHARVVDANPAPTNHRYMVGALAWTLPGDSTRGNPNDFRPTAYDASLDSLRLFRMEGTNAIELPLPPLHHGPNNHPNRLVQLLPDNRATIEIPDRVGELRADVTMTFIHRGTGNRETREFRLRMLKRERSNHEPALD
jgi:hypothetical protein